MSPEQVHAMGNIGVLLLAVGLAGLGWNQNHTMMRHGLFAAATWIGGVFTMRALNALGIGTIEQARVFNSWLAWICIGVLISALLTTWLVERRVRRE